MNNFKYIIFNKPYGVLCQFTGQENDKTLSEFNLPKGVYPAGRLDKDSEGLLLLTDDGIFNQKVTNPKSKKEKTYHVQVERIPNSQSLELFMSGTIKIENYTCKRAFAKIIEPNHPPRVPPIRVRKTIPDCWLEIKITEGKNRQVRKMTAKIGHPTLRLIRVQIGKYINKDLMPGQWIEVSKKDIL